MLEKVIEKSKRKAQVKCLPGEQLMGDLREINGKFKNWTREAKWGEIAWRLKK